MVQTLSYQDTIQINRHRRGGKRLAPDNGACLAQTPETAVPL